MMLVLSVLLLSNFVASTSNFNSRDFKPCAYFESSMIKLENCRQCDVVLTDDFEPDKSFGEELYDERVDGIVHVLNIIYPKSWSAATAGRFADRFLTPRPWWLVINELYSWDWRTERVKALRLVRMITLDTPLKEMAIGQFPINCAEQKYTLRCTGDFNEYGAEFGNIESLYDSYSGSVVDETVGMNAHWVHDNYCPKIHNKFRCAFLPPHNCTVKSLEAGYCPGAISTYDKATLDAAVIPDYRDTLPRRSITQVNSEFTVFNLEEMFHFDKYKSRPDNKGLTSHLFYIGYLFRQNYDYRSRVANFVAEYRRSHNFPSTRKCIAFHIRRGDRVIDGKNMVDHCAYIKEFCLNATNSTVFTPSNGAIFSCAQFKFDYYGLGCHSAVPYGGLSFDMYMKAAEIISKNTNGVKTILVMTNDHSWSVDSSKAYESQWDILVSPQPPHFRGSSVDHGVINQGSIELTQQCDSIIGHFDSAFTNLLFNYMCFRHGSSDDLKFGTCPTRFDFSALAD